MEHRLITALPEQTTEKRKRELSGSERGKVTDHKIIPPDRRRAGPTRRRTDRDRPRRLARSDSRRLRRPRSAVRPASEFITSPADVIHWELWCRAYFVRQLFLSLAHIGAMGWQCKRQIPLNCDHVSDLIGSVRFTSF